MPNIQDFKQANADIAHVQGGSQGAPRDGYVLGARSGNPTFIPWEGIRNSFALAAGTQVAYFNHFLGFAGGTAAPAEWVEDAGSTGTVLPEGTTGEAGGQIEFTTAATQDDHITLALGTHWTTGNGWLIGEFRVQLDVIADAVLEVGFSDALSETSGLAFSDHTVAGVTDVATNAAILVFDSAAGTSWLANTANDGAAQAVDTGVAGTTDYVTIRIQISPTGDAAFYVGGSLVAEVTDAVDLDVELTPWISVVALAASAVTASVDYVGIVGDNA